jgi:hypothetical protein
MSPEEFLSLAGRLAAMGAGGEAAVRTIVSRAYYGAFHFALEFLVELGFQVPANANAHGLVRRMLLGSHHPEAARIAALLGDLHSDRIRADYRLSDSRYRTFVVARLHVERAETVRSMVNACRSEPARSELQAAIRDYQSRLN